MSAMQQALLMGGGGIPAPTPASAYQTTLWTGDGTSGRAISTIDLSSGGIVLLRRRNATDAARIYLSANGTNVYGAQLANASTATYATPPISFTSGGFTLSDATHNVSAATYEAWCFRKVPRFCDVVTYTGDDAVSRALSHSMRIVPGIMLVTRVDGTNNSSGVRTYNRIRGADLAGSVNADNYVASGNWASTAANSSNFTVGKSGAETHVNATGIPYAAALFGYDPASGGVITDCIWTGNGSTSGPTVTTGMQPQVLILTGGGVWRVADNVRTPSFSGNEARAYLSSSLSDDTGWGNAIASVDSTGFTIGSASAEINTNAVLYTGLVVKQ